MKVLLTTLCLFAVIYKTQGTDRFLECWHCSSDTGGAENFCATEFSESSIPTDLLKANNKTVLRSCNSTIDSEHERAVCRKTVEEKNGKITTMRFCYYTNKADPLDHCQKEETDKNVKRIFCEDCLTDRCNSASEVVGTITMLILPILISRKAIV